MELTDLSEYVFERDRQEFALGDTLDLKAGLLLASLTFLAIQSGDLITKLLPHIQYGLQLLSLCCLVIGGIFCTLELWPRDYWREATPDEYEVWMSDLDEHHRQYPNADAPPTLSTVRFANVKRRIQMNAAINQKKSRFMIFAFYCIIVAFVANIVTLAMRLF